MPSKYPYCIKEFLSLSLSLSLSSIPITWTLDNRTRYDAARKELNIQDHRYDGSTPARTRTYVISLGLPVLSIIIENGDAVMIVIIHCQDYIVFGCKDFDK